MKCALNRYVYVSDRSGQLKALLLFLLVLSVLGLPSSLLSSSAMEKPKAEPFTNIPPGEGKFESFPLKKNGLPLSTREKDDSQSLRQAVSRFGGLSR